MKILVLVLIGLNVIVIAPYAFGYMKAAVQALSGDGIALNFPYIRIYSETANFFQNVMYKIPAVYLSVIPVNQIFPISYGNKMDSSICFPKF